MCEMDAWDNEQRWKKKQADIFKKFKVLTEEKLHTWSQRSDISQQKEKRVDMLKKKMLFDWLTSPGHECKLGKSLHKEFLCSEDTDITVDWTCSILKVTQTTRPKQRRQIKLSINDYISMHSTLWLRSNTSNKHSSCSSIPVYMLIIILWISQRHVMPQRG